MNVSIATKEDIPKLVDYCRILHDQSKYRIYDFDYGKVHKAITVAVGRDIREGVILCSKQDGKTVGALGALAVEPAFSTQKMGSEYLWWVEPTIPNYKRRLIELLNGYEYWAKNVADCKAVIVSKINLNIQAGYFSRRGYDLYEETFLKELH